MIFCEYVFVTSSRLTTRSPPRPSTIYDRARRHSNSISQHGLVIIDGRGLVQFANRLTVVNSNNGMHMLSHVGSMLGRRRRRRVVFLHSVGVAL